MKAARPVWRRERENTLGYCGQGSASRSYPTIPIEKDEIIYHLKQARIQNKMIVETRELINLRKYVAACLLKGDILQRANLPNAPNKNGEMAFVISLSSAINDSITEIWTDLGEDENKCMAYAEWVLNNLYLDTLGISKAISLSMNKQDDSYLTGLSLARLISPAIGFISLEQSNDSSLCQKYSDWLFNRVLRKRFEVEPNLLAIVSDILKKILFDVSEKAIEKYPEPATIQILQQFYNNLPKPLQEELGYDSDFMVKIGLKFLTTITILDLEFDLDEFIHSVSEAVNGRETKIAPIELDAEIVLYPFEGDELFYFEHPLTKSRIVIKNEDLKILFDSPIKREEILRQNRYWFDCSSDTFNKEVAKIASNENPRQRFDKVKSWQNSSAAFYYKNLYQKLKERQSFQFSELIPPSSEGLLRHFRFASDVGGHGAFQNAYENSAAMLLNEEGVQTAILRFVGLPVPLPSVLVDTIKDFSPDDKRLLIKQLIKTTGSPVSKIHLVYILLQFGKDQPVYRRLARRVITSFFSENGKKEFDAFLAVLKWVNSEFGYWVETRSWSSYIRLAIIWAHAHRLFTILVSIGIPISWIQEKFQQNFQQRMPLDIFERSPDYWLDITHPRLVNRELFLFAGLSYSLSEIDIDFVDKELRNLFTSDAFFEENKIKYQITHLLNDTTLAKNGLNSFLAGDNRTKGLSVLFEKEDAEKLSSLTLSKLAEQLVNILSEDSNNLTAWMHLYAICGSFPPYENLIGKLKEIILKTNFASLVQENLKNGGSVMLVASQQAINLADKDVCSYLRDQMVKISEFLANIDINDTSLNTKKESDSNLRENICIFLFDSALNISIALQSSEGVVTEFSNIIMQLVDSCNSIAPICRPIIQRLCEELPSSQAKNLWPLLVRLRAE